MHAADYNTTQVEPVNKALGHMGDESTPNTVRHNGISITNDRPLGNNDELAAAALNINFEKVAERASA
jgi:hypothetical protein